MRHTVLNFVCFARQSRALAVPLRNYTPKTELHSVQTPARNGFFMLPNLSIVRPLHSSVIKHSNGSCKGNAAAQEGNENKLSLRDRLKSVVQEYGTTAIVFHVSISLTSLGLCYAAVKRLVAFYVSFYFYLPCFVNRFTGISNLYLKRNK